MDQYSELREALNKLCQDVVEEHNKQYPTLAGSLEMTYSKGQKFIKVIREGDSQRSVWGFINLSHPDFRFGDILMSKSWKGPALNKARGNILDGYEIRGMRIYGPDYLI